MPTRKEHVCSRINSIIKARHTDQVVWSPAFRKWLCADCRSMLTEAEQAKTPGAQQQWLDEKETERVD